MIKSLRLLKKPNNFKYFTCVPILTKYKYDKLICNSNNNSNNKLLQNKQIEPILNFQNINITNFQYVSDIHYEYNENIKIEPASDVLIIAGDIGNPFGAGFEDFLHYVSSKFKKIIYVAGNHCLHDYTIFNETLYNNSKHQITKICNKFNNVYFLDNNYYIHRNIVIVGTPLWTNLSPNLKYIDKKTIDLHNSKHSESVQFIEKICKFFKRNKIVAVTHYVPTDKLIDEKYKLDQVTNSKWVTNLEHIMKQHSNLCTWICGHTHSVKSVEINHQTHKTNCMVNAHGYNSSNEIILTKTFSL